VNDQRSLDALIHGVLSKYNWVTLGKMSLNRIDR
jgi:hypothetical protein